MKYFILILLTINVAAAQSELEARGWLKVSCHSNDHKSTFTMMISEDELAGINQITEIETSGEIRKALETDSQIYYPQVALVHRLGNNMEMLIRYDTGLLWDTFLNVKMIYSPDGYQTSLKVEGDKGAYLNQATQYQCKIGYREKTYLKTSGY